MESGGDAGKGTGSGGEGRSCVIPELNPFDPSVSKYFRRSYANYAAPCPAWKSPFLVRHPNWVSLRPERRRHFAHCTYEVIVGAGVGAESSADTSADTSATSKSQPTMGQNQVNLRH